MTGWPVTVGVVDTRLTAATLSGRGARLYCTQGGLGVVTGISAASTEGVLVLINDDGGCGW